MLMHLISHPQSFLLRARLEVTATMGTRAFADHRYLRNPKREFGLILPHICSLIFVLWRPGAYRSGHSEFIRFLRCVHALSSLERLRGILLSVVNYDINVFTVFDNKVKFSNQLQLIGINWKLKQIRGGKLALEACRE